VVLTNVSPVVVCFVLGIDVVVDKHELLSLSVGVCDSGVDVYTFVVCVCSLDVDSCVEHY